MKTINIFGKTISATALALILIAGIGSAALLTYYGTITATANVYQSILLDGKDVNSGSLAITDVIPEPAPGGEKFCTKHILKNQMSVEGTVDLEMACSNNIVGHESDCSGVTATYLKALPYEFGPTSSLEIIPGQYYPTNIIVEDGDCTVTWTFDMVGSKQLVGNGHWGYGLAISLDGIHPAFQIHNNDGTDPDYAWGTHLYSPWDNGWHSSDTNTPVKDLDWVSATGERDVQYDGEGKPINGIFTVTIDKCKLGMENIYWAAWFGVGGFYSPNNGYSSYPNGFMWQDNVNGYYYQSHIMDPVTSLTIPSKAEQSFCTCYGFAQNIWPGTYTITTNIVPA